MLGALPGCLTGYFQQTLDLRKLALEPQKFALERLRSGMSPAESALLARRSDVVIVFGIRVEGEGYDLPDPTLPWGQDAAIEAVAEANPNTIVLLETGNPAAMPWRDKVKAIVEAWYPGQAGGGAIARCSSARLILPGAC